MGIYLFVKILSQWRKKEKEGGQKKLLQLKLKKQFNNRKLRVGKKKPTMSALLFRFYFILSHIVEKTQFSFNLGLTYVFLMTLRSSSALLLLGLDG